MPLNNVATYILYAISDTTNAIDSPHLHLTLSSRNALALPALSSPMQHAAAPSADDGDEVHRKAKLLALLDRARVNRGLQPELGGQLEALDDRSPPIKLEPSEAARGHAPPEHQKEAPTCTCSQTHEATPSNAHSRVPNVPGAPYQKNRGPDDEIKATRDDAPADGAAVPRPRDSAGDAVSYAHSTTDSDTSEDAAMTQESQVAAVHTEVKNETAEQPVQSRVAVLSSTPKPRIADLTGGSRANVPRLQQLKALEEPRNTTTQHAHPEPQREEKQSVKRENPPRAQQKQPRNNAAPTNTTAVLKKLAQLTPDEYEDSELHGDFQHMLHILIPSNATAALLERRGQPIQSIGQQADCTLSIREPEASPFKDDRLLRIYGKAKGISLAQRLVVAYIRAYRAEKRDPNYMDLSDEAPPVALPATSITKAMSVAVSSGKKSELEITSPYHWMVQREDVGKMMGRQGAILASIRRDTGTSIHVDENVVPGTTERRVVLTGSVDSIAVAVEEIRSKAGGRPEAATSVANGRLGQYFAIPYHATGFLIGPQGSTVKNIAERTGARLQIPSPEDLPLGSVNRILHMQGTPKQAEHARRVVSAKLRDYLASSKCPKMLTPSSTGRKGDKVTIKVLLPSRICGFMLNQRGKLIREISEKSGAHTHFLAPHDDENRVCVFTGDMGCVLRAQRLVLQVIAGDAISSKHAAPRKRKRSQREEKEAYADEAEEAEFIEEEEPYYEDDVEEECYDDGYEESSRQPLRRPQHDYYYGEDEDIYMYDGGYEVEYEERPPARRRPITTRPSGYIQDVDAHNHDQQIPYESSRSRPPKRPIVVRRQPRSRHRDEYDGEYDGHDNYNDDAYGDDGGTEYEQSVLARKKIVKRRAVGGRGGDQRQSVVLHNRLDAQLVHLGPGRRVQMVAPASGPRDGRSRLSPSDRRRPSTASSVRSSTSRSGSVNSRHSVPRGGRGNGRPSVNGRPSAGRGRGNANKRRRQ
ncbi:unnamed protein product [Phytophthora fragariaefolia]|uniref:Unnamed protein product n=1 Tax=Phytophthora fragariaefolia TaxID=1490495 RepID=A0A9W6XV01_9STRA|nr:unnamed protein product [Phytophthora fragariaefolia]